MRVLARVAVVCGLALLSACGDEMCNTGTCRFEGNLTACVSREAYARLSDEFAYINRTGDTSRIRILYATGLCKRFPTGTRVHVLESSGLFRVKIRFLDRPGQPDMWINPEFLERA